MTAHVRGAALILAMLVAALAATVAVALAVRAAALVRRRRQSPRSGAGAVARAGRRAMGAADPARTMRAAARSTTWASPGRIRCRRRPSPTARSKAASRTRRGAQPQQPGARQHRGRRWNACAWAASSPRRVSTPACSTRSPTGSTRIRAPRANGAEDEYYAQRSPTALAANAPLVRTAEITSVRGAKRECLGSAGLRRRRAACVDTALNINTANADVIAAAIPDLAGDKLAAFIAERARKPFTTMAELRERLPRDVALPEKARRSSSPAATSWSASGRGRATAIAQARALLKRDGRRVADRGLADARVSSGAGYTIKMLQFARCRHATRFFVAFSKRRCAAARSRRSYFVVLFLVAKRGDAFFPRFATN